MQHVRSPEEESEERNWMFIARRRLIKKLEVLLQPRDRLPDSCCFL